MASCTRGFPFPGVIPDSEGRPGIVPTWVCVGIWSSRGSVWFRCLKKTSVKSRGLSRGAEPGWSLKRRTSLRPGCARHMAVLRPVPLLPGLMLPIWSAQMHDAPRFLLFERYNHYCSRYPKSYKHPFKRNAGIVFLFSLMRSSFRLALLAGWRDRGAACLITLSPGPAFQPHAPQTPSLQAGKRAHGGL